MTPVDRAVFDVSWRAILKVLAALALVWVWWQLWHLVMVIILSIIIAVSLDPAVRWLERHRVSRGLGAFGLVFLLSAVGLLLGAVSWVTLRDQSRLIAQRMTDFTRQLRESFPLVDRIWPAAREGGVDGFSDFAIATAQSAAGAVGMIVVALALTVYLLIEWKATLEWVLAFVPERHRTKARRTLAEAREIVYRYAVGNAIASLITGVATYIALASLGVPASLMLAIISGLLNFIPVIGFILSSVLAAVLAATVSLTVLMLVIGFYLVFNVIENYLITPKVFGYQMELSDLAVLVAVIVGAELGGVIGALLALPVAALYPPVERIWLRGALGEDTVERHERLSA